MIALAAISKNGVMGNRSDPNTLPWAKQKDDMKWFKEITWNKTLVVGPKTYGTISTLPNRNFLVIANLERYQSIAASDKLVGVCAPELLKSSPKMFHNGDFVLAGGAWLYEKALSLCTDLYLTIFDDIVDLGDNILYFPFEQWQLKDMFKDVIEVRRLQKGTIYRYRV